MQIEEDAARRCSDIITQHITDSGENAFGRWAAIRLSDGGSDSILYDTKQDAVRHQLHEMMCAYICIPPGGMPVADAASFLATNRKLYAAGMRLSDPDRHVQMPMQREFR